MKVREGERWTCVTSNILDTVYNRWIHFGVLGIWRRYARFSDLLDGESRIESRNKAVHSILYLSICILVFVRCAQNTSGTAILK